jgi:rSAM/selenodomain-associated transferase 1
MGARQSLLLLQFARVPVPGEVKTRLIPTLGKRLAAELHCSMLLRTLDTLRGSGLGPVQLWLTGGGAAGWLRQIDPDAAINVCEQVGADLGQRMEGAIASGLCEYEKVLLVGSDAPAIDASYLALAAEALDRADVVFGPALDGGYVLLGMRRTSEGWLRGVRWGTSEVLEQSSRAATRHGLSVQLLQPLPDIDVADDLRWLPTDFCSLQLDGAQALILASRLAELAAERV